MTSLFCSASTTASCTHFMAVSKSTISPLRTPREGDWPTPRILFVPSGRPSPTTTQIFEVPISRPTIKSLLPICFLLSWRRHRDGPANGWRDRTGGMFGRWSDTRSCRRVPAEFERLMKRDCFHAARLLLRLDCLIDYIDSRFGERDRNVSLHHQVGRSQLLLRIVAVDQKFFEALQLCLQIIKAERNLRVVFIGHHQAVTFRKVDLANLEPRLHKTARAQAQQLERCLCLERFDDRSRRERLARAS